MKGVDVVVEPAASGDFGTYHSVGFEFHKDTTCSEYEACR
jgi:hypothetical protein